MANVNSAHAEEIEKLNELNGKKIDYLQEQIVTERGRAHEEYIKLLDETPNIIFLVLTLFFIYSLSSVPPSVFSLFCGFKTSRLIFFFVRERDTV